MTAPPGPPAAAWRARFWDLGSAAALCVAKLALGAWVLHAGFSHVSDDDYARTVIAEQFAHAPKLDPSGTSWLPFPFWVEGAAMLIFGRSLDVARGVAIAAGALSVAAPFFAMRATGVPRGAALAATAVASALPWNAWLGVATVPDGWVGAVLAASAIAMRVPSARPWAAAGLFATALSRYEAWPVCAIFAIACFWRRAPRGAAVAYAAGAIAGPLLWMAWNAHAHGSPVHFVARVTAFRRAIGAASVPWTEKAFGYPLAFVTETPEAAVLGACGAIGLARSAALRARWGWAAAAMVAVVAFLVAGDLGDGAPTHHPARALASTWWVAIGMGVDAAAAGLGELRGVEFVRLPTFLRFLLPPVLALLLTLGWAVTLPPRWQTAPGSGESERRDAQIARGLDLRARGVTSAEITPCQFEHFALLAAWGEPERARLNQRSRRPVTRDCPELETP